MNERSYRVHTQLIHENVHLDETVVSVQVSRTSYERAPKNPKKTHTDFSIWRIVTHSNDVFYPGVFSTCAIFQINFGLLIFSLCGFLLPAYLFYHRKNLIKEKAARDKHAMGPEIEALNHTGANGYKLQSNGLTAIEAWIQTLSWQSL